LGEVTLGPWPLGIDNVSPDNRLTADDRGRVISLRDAVNVDIDRAGQPSRRPGLTVANAAAAHSLWACRLGAFCMVGAALNRVSLSGGTMTLTPLMTLASAEPVSYTELMNRVVFSNSGTIGEITPTGVRQLGVPEPASFALSADSAGGLFPGRYGVVVTNVSATGEESAASALAMVDVAANGGLLLTGLSHTTTLRVYRTEANGDVLYRAAEVPAGMTEYLIGAGQLGKVCDTRHMARTPPGRIVRYWNGRLLIARGRHLYFTEALRYGLVDPRHAFVTMPGRITMVRPVDAGVFVSTSAGVRFLRGNAPSAWEVVDTSSEPAVEGTDIEIAASILSGDAGGRKAALWLTGRGFVIGGADGTVTEPQAARIRLAAQAGGIAVNDRRLVAIVK
jgi:hypothetical protein